MKRSSCRTYVISLAVILTLPFVFLPNAALATEYSSTPIDFPGASYTYAFGVNHSGVLVGYYGDSTGEHGYLYDGVNFTPINVPGASYTVALGINNSGVIVGYYGDSSWRYHGYIYNAGKFTYPIDVPGASYTVALGINDSGAIVGYYGDATQNHGYLDDRANLTYPLDFPGASHTYAFGINDSGVIVGFYSDATGGNHGFVKSPVSKAVSKPVSIDIKPGCHLNSTNLKSKGKIPVAILSTKDFDAPSQVDRNSLTFGRTGDEQSLAFCNRRPEHVNRDGLKDLVCHFYIPDTGFQCDDTKGILKGKTLDGTPIEGTDSIRIVPCKKVPCKHENKRK